MLFEIEVGGSDVEQVLARLAPRDDDDGAVRAFAEALVRGVQAQRAALDRHIVDAARNWRLERMAAVDRSVLRIAVYELLTEASPAAVVIDEAVEIAKRFGGEQSGSFINGLLDTVRKKIDAERSRTPS